MIRGEPSARLRICLEQPDSKLRTMTANAREQVRRNNAALPSPVFAQALLVPVALALLAFDIPCAGSLVVMGVPPSCEEMRYCRAYGGADGSGRRDRRPRDAIQSYFYKHEL